jgi:hypothetical protein
MQTYPSVVCIDNNTKDLAHIRKMLRAIGITNDIRLFHCPKVALEHLTEAETEPLFILVKQR